MSFIPWAQRAPCPLRRSLVEDNNLCYSDQVKHCSYIGMGKTNTITWHQCRLEMTARIETGKSHNPRTGWVTERVYDPMYLPWVWENFRGRLVFWSRYDDSCVGGGSIKRQWACSLAKDLLPLFGVLFVAKITNPSLGVRGVFKQEMCFLCKGTSE